MTTDNGAVIDGTPAAIYTHARTMTDLYDTMEGLYILRAMKVNTLPMQLGAWFRPEINAVLFFKPDHKPNTSTLAKEVIDYALVDMEKRHSRGELLIYPASMKITKTVDTLVDALGLTPIERKLLQLGIEMSSPLTLSRFKTISEYLYSSDLDEVIAKVLDEDVEEIYDVMYGRSPLASSGLVKTKRTIYSHECKISARLRVTNRYLRRYALKGSTDLKEIFLGSHIPSPPSTLAENDFKHVAMDLQIATNFLLKSLEVKTPGVNIFIYGPPGTGKTEFARYLTSTLNATSLEIQSISVSGKPVGLADRLGNFNVAQRLYHDRTVVICDEVEGFFANRPQYDSDALSYDDARAWILNMLESNPSPSIWISNSRRIDPAVLRRFDMVIEMPIPPLETRQRIVDRYSAGMISDKLKKSIAKHSNIPPATVERAIKVARLSQSDTVDSETFNDDVTNRLLCATLKAQGRNAQSLLVSDSLKLPYSHEYLNSSIDIHTLADKLSKHGEARICLYGPPGTGKSEFGKWLSDKLELPLLIKRGSDLRSKWVGETEKLLAEAFEEAERTKSILMIDEFDGFGMARDGDLRSFEVNQVNELLVCLENYKGLFIATTNRHDSLDPAMMRRFDLRVELKPLTQLQLAQLFDAVCELVDIPLDPQFIAYDRLANVSGITPGDLQALVRRSRFEDITTPQKLYALLLEDVAYKQNKSSIGFT